MLRRGIAIISVLWAACSLALAQQRGGFEALSSALPAGSTEAERRILAVLADMAKSGQTYLSVPVADGKVLRLIAEAADAKSITEIGTSTGYSGLWFCLALARTGGHLTTFEIDHPRASMARRHFQAAGVEGLVTIVEGDAHQTLAQRSEPVDVAFIDADKSGYIDYLHKILPRVRPGGLILAHNIDMVPDYLQAVTTNPDLETIIYTEGAGLAVTLKKR